MSDTAVNAPGYAISAIAAADIQIAAVTNSIANQIDTSQPTAPFGSSAVAAPPVTGTQPSGAASQVFQALQSSPSAGSGPAPSVSRSGNNEISFKPDAAGADAQGLVAQPNPTPAAQSVAQLTAANAFTANVQTLQNGAQAPRRILDLTT